jgi:hypothetical protein
MAQRTQQRTNARNRSALDPSLPRTQTPALVDSVVTGGPNSVARMTFAGRVMARGVPGFRAGAGAAETVVGVQQVGATVLDLTFSGDVAGTDMVVGEADPGVRTPGGGFVPAGTYAIAPPVP